MKFSFSVSRSTRCFLLFLAGMFSASAFQPYSHQIVLVATFSLLLFWLNRAKSAGEACLYGFSFGFGLGVLSLGWICQALLIDDGAYLVFVPICLMGLGLAMGVFWLFPAWVSWYAPKGGCRWLAFACGVTFFEWVRSWLFTGFPWNLVGSVWTDVLPILQFASVFGVFGLSFVTVLICSSLALLPAKKPLLLSVFLFCLIFGLGALRIYQSVPEDVFGVRLRLVQPNIPQSLKWDGKKAAEHMDTLLRLSKNNNDQVTHVIWPESAIPYLIEINEPERLRLMGAVRQGGTLITGAMRVVSEENRLLANSVFILDDMAQIVGFADKSHLVPFGEYVPLRGILPLDKLVPIPSDFVSGAGVRTHLIPKAPPASLLVCYEVIFPHQVTEPKRRPEWIVNVTNDGWYGLSAGPYQHLGMAQLRAVEEGLPVVRVANTGVSAVISPLGQILTSIPLGEQGIVDASLPRCLGKTLYASWGNIPVLVLICALFGGLLIRRRKNPEKNEKSA